MIEVDWDAWRKDALADAERRRQEHRLSQYAHNDRRCPDCVLERDRRVARLLAEMEAAGA